jgi:hypothetical protein
MGQSFQQPLCRSRSTNAARWALPLLASMMVVMIANRAQAACGYYVVAAKPGAELAGMAAGGQHEMPASPRQQAPCHGPNCQAGKQGAAPVAVIPVTPDTQAACCESGAKISGGGGSWIVLNRDASMADVYLPTSDPPPRAA